MADGFWVNFDGLDELSGKERKKRFGNLDIVMTGFAGLCGSVALAYEKYNILQSRYPAAFLKEAQKQERFLAWEYSVLEQGITVAYPLSEGGVFAGLWKLGECVGIGLQVYLKQIPIKQETVEICNFFDVNPYQMQSEGSSLLLSENGYRLKRRLLEKGIFSEVIGVTTEDNDRVVINGEERRYLQKQYADALAIARGECMTVS